VARRVIEGTSLPNIGNSGYLILLLHYTTQLGGLRVAANSARKRARSPRAIPHRSPRHGAAWRRSKRRWDLCAGWRVRASFAPERGSSPRISSEDVGW